MMRRTSRLILAFLALSFAGCPEQVYDELTARYPADGDTPGAATLTSGSATETPTPTTTDPAPADPGVQTVTSASEGTAETMVSDLGTTTASDPSTGPQENAPPTIELFDVVPDHLDEAGPAELQLIASDDVVKVRLTLDDENLADLTLADFPRTWDALSAKDNGPERKFKVVVEDAEGLTAEAEDKLSILLPQSGAEKCIFTDAVDGAVISVISALTYTPKGDILAVGTRGPPGALRMTAWMLDPNTCKPLPSWPKSFENWSVDDDYEKTPSFGTAVALDEDGNLVVAGNFIVGTKPQGYVALLNSAGALLWEKAAQVGDEVTSVAAGTEQFSNRVFVGGSTRTSDDPVRTDGSIWIYHATADDVFVGPPITLRAPFTPEEFNDEFNSRSEWVRAILTQPGTGYAVAVGEREFKISPNEIYSRTFIVRVHPLGAVVGTPWTSPANASFVHDAMRSIAVCGDGLMAGGWTRDKPVDAEPVPMMFWIDAAGSAMKHRADPQMPSTETHGIACDREGKIVSAATRTLAATDAQVFAVLGPDDPRISYDSGVPGNDAAVAVACDGRGFCGRGGYRTANAKPHAVVRIHHP